MRTPLTGRYQICPCVGLLIGFLTLACPILTPATLSAQEHTPDSQKTPAIPTASKLLTRCFRAMGGETTIDSIQSLAFKGSIRTQGMKIATISMDFAKGNRSFVTFQVQTGTQTSITTFGCDGTRAWEMELPSDSPTAVASRIRILSPTELTERIRANNWLGRVLHLAAEAKSMETTGREKFHGHDSWVVMVKTQIDQFQAFFDVETNLINGFRLSVQQPLEPNQIDVPDPIYLDIVFSKWSHVGDLNLFHQVQIIQSNQEITIFYDEISINQVKPEQFAIPPQVLKVIDAMTPKTPTPDTDGN